jgi:hypothetical protein
VSPRIRSKVRARSISQTPVAVRMPMPRRTAARSWLDLRVRLVVAHRAGGRDLRMRQARDRAQRHHRRADHHRYTPRSNTAALASGTRRTGQIRGSRRCWSGRAAEEPAATPVPPATSRPQPIQPRKSVPMRSPHPGAAVRHEHQDQRDRQHQPGDEAAARLVVAAQEQVHRDQRQTAASGATPVAASADGARHRCAGDHGRRRGRARTRPAAQT